MKPEQEISIRHFEKEGDYFACETLQKETWGKDIEEVVTAPLAKIVQKIGGIAAGAFKPDGEMVGFVFGLSGFKDGRPVHWSHMLAVKPAYRDAGIGRKLKLFQRHVLLGMDINEVFWSYDPLAAKNAHFNLCTLGAEVTEYVRDMYGTGEDSILFRGVGTDRFVVVWRIADKSVDELLQKQRCFDRDPFLASALAVSRESEIDPDSFPVDKPARCDNKLRVEIPADVHRLMHTSLAAATGWRKNTRNAFEHYMHRGYRVVGFYVDEISGRSFYCLELKA